MILNGNPICNDLTVCDWKYIADQRLEQDENGFVHDADYYATIEPELTLPVQIAAINNWIIEKELGL